MCERDKGWGLVLKAKTKRCKEQGKERESALSSSAIFSCLTRKLRNSRNMENDNITRNLYLQWTLMGRHGTSLQNSG